MFTAASEIQSMSCVNVGILLDRTARDGV